jgi:hypothetical protein
VKDGTRALIYAAVMVGLAFLLSWLLKDASPFNMTAGPSALGKFGYDAMRDKAGPVLEEK